MRDCCTPGVLLGVPRVSDSNQPSRAMTLQESRACSAVLLPCQCRAHSEEESRDGRQGLSQDPKSRLQIAVIRVVIPAGSLGWVLSKGAHSSKKLIGIGHKRRQGVMEEEMKSLWWVGSLKSHTEQSGLCGG